MCRYARDKVLTAKHDPVRPPPEPASRPPVTEPHGGEPAHVWARWRGWSTAGIAAILGLGTLAGLAYGQPFGAVVGPPAFELAPLPVCNEGMIEEVSYERAGMKRYLVLPENNPQVWYVLGISNTTGLDAGASISRVDCSVINIVNDPAQQRPWCKYMPNPGPFCIGIIGPATRN
jgi:hypothetical protein